MGEVGFQHAFSAPGTLSDGDSMRVSGQVGDQVLGSGEGLLGVDDPLGVSGLVEMLAEGAGALEAGAGAVAEDGSGADGRFGLLEELPAEGIVKGP